ncbi:MAG: Ig domain-containing protein [Firmicutes bacterium]|nr:Ig domain-containing protein [Bacillota bacterium]
MSALTWKRSAVRILFITVVLIAAAMVMPQSESFAAPAEYLYITESDGGASINVPTGQSSGTGWSWDAENGVLTLNNYNGSAIEVPNGDITIELVGTNRVTIPTVGAANSSCGINVKNGRLTIKATNDPNASLWVGNTDMKISDQYYMGINGYMGIWLESGDLEVEMVNTASYSYFITGISVSGESLYVNGDAGLTVNIDSGAIESHALGCGLEYASSSNMTVSVVSSNQNCYAASSLRTAEGGTGNILLSCPNGYAIGNGVFAVHENAGNIRLQGLVKNGGTRFHDYMRYTYDLHVPSNHRFETVGGDALDCAFAYYDDGSHVYGYFLTDPSGSRITDCVLAAKGQEQPLRFVDSVLFDLPELKTETAMSTAFFQGAVFGGTAPYTFSVKNGTSLPEGLKITQAAWGTYFQAYINGTPTATGPAGSFVLVVTDSSEPAQTAEITVNYPEIAEKEKFMTVDGCDQFDSKSDVPAAGHPSWRWEAATETLYLNNYNGGPVWREAGDINIVLTGSNRVNIPEAPYDCATCNGIQAQQGDVTITEAANGSGLWIGNNAIETYYAYYNALIASGNITIEDTDVSVDLSDASANPGYYRNGFSSGNGTTRLMGDASLNMLINSPKSQCVGLGRGLQYYSSGDVNIQISGDSRSAAISGLRTFESGTGDISLRCPGGYAIGSGIIALHENLGTLTLEGYVKNGILKTDNYMQTLTDLNIPSNHTFQTAGGDPLTCGIAYYDDENTGISGQFLQDSTGALVTSCKLVPVAGTAPLSFIDCPTFDIPSLTVDSLYQTPFFHGAVLGGTRPYTFSVKDGTSQPDGLKLIQSDKYGTSSTNFYAYINGKPTGFYEAGSFVLVVTDSSPTPQTAEITVNYDGYKVDRPVTGITINKTGASMIIGQELALNASVLPNDASVQDISWTLDYSFFDVVSSDNNSFTLRAKKAGSTTVTVTSKEGSKTASCAVTIVKAENPATVDPDATVTLGGNIISLNDNISNAGAGSYSFAITDPLDGCTVTQSGSFKSGNVAGSCQVTVTFDETETYLQKEEVITVTVTEKTPVALTVTQADGVYGETLAEPEFDATGAVNQPAVTYSGTTHSGAGYGPSTSRPTEAGSYTVSVSFETMTEVVSGSKTFSIAKADFGNAEIFLDTQDIYDGEEHSVAISFVTYGGNHVNEGTDYTVTSGASATELGNNTLVLTGKGNYTGTVQAVWSLRGDQPHEKRRTMKSAKSPSEKVSITVHTDTGQVKVGGSASADAPVMVASYDEDGRFMGVTFVKGAFTVNTEIGAADVCVMWVDDQSAPLSEAINAELE